MPTPYSVDLRARVIEDVESGASRREAAERYGISPSVVVIWVQRFEETGSVAAKPSGGSISPLEQHAEFLLGLIANQPDLTLDEIVAAMRKRRIAGSRNAVWRMACVDTDHRQAKLFELGPTAMLPSGLSQGRSVSPPVPLISRTQRSPQARNRLRPLARLIPPGSPHRSMSASTTRPVRHNAPS